jgi:hypothetical protein
MGAVFGGHGRSFVFDLLGVVDARPDSVLPSTHVPEPGGLLLVATAMLFGIGATQRCTSVGSQRRTKGPCAANKSQFKA